MSETKQKIKNRLFSKLRNKYRLVIMNDDTYEEKFSLKLSPLNVFTFGGLFIILFTTALTSIIAFTPLREFIPGYADIVTRKMATYAAFKADSLESALSRYDAYFSNFNAILNDELKPDSSQKLKSIDGIEKVLNNPKSQEDSLLRLSIEQQEAYNINYIAGNRNKGLSGVFFFPPVKGVINDTFNLETEHFGMDILTPKNEVVKATLDGTVVFSGWTSETGYVIQIQHKFNIISVYKHNAVLLKRVGDEVKAGTAIAFVGDSGELSTGPHLHFEMWYNGKPINPKDYMNF